MKLPILTNVLAVILLMQAGVSYSAELKLDAPDFNLPDLGTPANNTLSTTEESALGLKLVREQRGSQPIIEDPELNDWLRALGSRLIAHAGGGNFYFLLSKDSAINASSMPGGVITLNAGIILNSSSESEVAAVLAHEIAHITQRHIARALADSKGSPLLTGLGVLAGAAAAKNSPDAGQALVTGALAAQAHQQLAFSRQMESEADRVGLRILAASQFDPQAMPLFMEKLDRRSSDLYGDITRYIRTHPLSIDRLSDTRQRANQLGKVPVREDNEYVYMREKLRNLLQSGSTPVTDGDENVARYVQALTQLRANQFAAVLKTLGDKSTFVPTAIVISQALNGLGEYQATEKLLQPLVNRYPQREGILLPLVEALLADNQAAKAWQLLNRVTITEQTTLDFLDMRQRVAEQIGQPIEAYRSAAERNLRIGEYRQARAILEQATRLPGIPAQTVARFQAMSQEITKLEARNKQLLE